MIIGNGLLGSIFIKYDLEHVIFFASGVSNSEEIEESEFNREKKLLENTIVNQKDKQLIYFSTCSIYDSSKKNSKYVLHKLEMEALISEKSMNYLIFRVSNIVGKGGNKNTLVNYFVNQIIHRKTIVIESKTLRNLIDIEDVRNIVFAVIAQNKKNQIINIASPTNYSIVEIVEKIEKYLGKKTEKEFLSIGAHYSIDINDVLFYFEAQPKNDYLDFLIKKYVGTT